MRAITLNRFDTRPALREDLSAPTPAANEVLVRVRASSVNPVDNAIAAGVLKDTAGSHTQGKRAIQLD
jgi:NADPH:quinone reductase-like Zn-dependent oxidoreductase